MASLIPTSTGQVIGASQSLISTATATGLNTQGLAAMTKTATNLTAAGANLLKLNQQSASAVQGLLPNGTLTVDSLLNKAKTGLDSVFSAQGAKATATQFFKSAQDTANKIAADVKSVVSKLSSGTVSAASLTPTASLGSLSNIAAAAKSAVNYIPGASSVIQQVGAVSATTAKAVTATVDSLKVAGSISGINVAQLSAANPQVTQAISGLSQAAKISAPGVSLPTSLPAIPGLPAIPSIDPAQLKAATAAISAAQNPPNPLASVGTAIGAVDRSKIDAAFTATLPPGLPSFNPGTISAAQQAGTALNQARFKNTKDEDLTYSGPDPLVWDEINSERLRRNLPGLPNPRPAEDSDYVKKYSQPANNGG